MNDYETQRAAKIAKNQALLAELDIKPLGPQRESRQKRTNGGDQPSTKKRRLQQDTAPSRVSARLASAPLKPNYTDEPDIKPVSLPRSADRSTKKNKLGSIVKEETEALVPVKDIDEVRSGWSSWEATAPEPTRDENAVFRFEDEESFTPNKSPEEMLREGVFGGSYFRPLRSRKLGIVIEGDWKDTVPDQWIEGLNLERYLTNPEYDAEINKFHRACGQSIEEWEAAGWISHEHDVRGWFQWYCRFFQGRRCDDDERQIGRWRKCVGETGRFKRTLLKQYGRAGVRTVEEDDDDEDDERPGISPVVSQTCLHWAFEVRQDDLDRWYQS